METLLTFSSVTNPFNPSTPTESTYGETLSSSRDKALRPATDVDVAAGTVALVGVGAEAVGTATSGDEAASAPRR